MIVTFLCILVLTFFYNFLPIGQCNHDLESWIESLQESSIWTSSFILCCLTLSHWICSPSWWLLNVPNNLGTVMTSYNWILTSITGWPAKYIVREVLELPYLKKPENYVVPEELFTGFMVTIHNGKIIIKNTLEFGNNLMSTNPW